jgi:GTPase
LVHNLESESRERAILVGVITRKTPRQVTEEYLDELELLADTAGAEILERVVQERDRVDPAFMIGRGKVAELAQMAKFLDADLIIFDDDLTPAQAKNIEQVCGVKILDRSGLILDIFAKHARTRESRTQVELAQLRYRLPRLTRQWSHLSRQLGGIGVRGPGESQLEEDRRLIYKRIAVLEEELEKISRQRTIRRKNRQEVFKVALVGYTNVGKSTLLNALTHAGVLVQDRLFATLDATVRSLNLADHLQILLIDTVGFIRKLPHHLVASFKSTLEEAAAADLLLHIIDITHPACEDQMKTVDSVLADLKLNDRPVLRVFNKIDRLSEADVMRHHFEKSQPCAFISAERGINLAHLLALLQEKAESSFMDWQIALPISQAAVVAKLHQLAWIVKIDYEDERILVQAKIRINAKAKVEQWLQAALAGNPTEFPE